MDEKILRKVQLSELEILEEIDRICKKHNIKYFLCGGTLLGAVRHKGFIPWDDDIDIGMLRKDYNKFIKVSSQELCNRFILDCYKTNKKVWYSYAKLKLRNTIYLEKTIKNYDINHGMWVDIFPYDNVNKYNGILQRICFKNMRFWQAVILIKTGLVNFTNFAKQHKYMVKVIKIIFKLLPLRLLLLLSNMFVSINRNENSKYITQYTGNLSMKKETQLRNDVFPLSKIKFEGKEFFCPREYDNVLKNAYGDYMKIPKEEDRITHNPMKIKFEDGEEIKF